MCTFFPPLTIGVLCGSQLRDANGLCKKTSANWRSTLAVIEWSKGDTPKDQPDIASPLAQQYLNVETNELIHNVWLPRRAPTLASKTKITGAIYLEKTKATDTLASSLPSNICFVFSNVCESIDGSDSQSRKLCDGKGRSKRLRRVLGANVRTGLTATSRSDQHIMPHARQQLTNWLDWRTTLPKASHPNNNNNAAISSNDQEREKRAQFIYHYSIRASCTCI